MSPTRKFVKQQALLQSLLWRGWQQNWRIGTIFLTALIALPLLPHHAKGDPLSAELAEIQLSSANQHQIDPIDQSIALQSTPSSAVPESQFPLPLILGLGVLALSIWWVTHLFNRKATQQILEMVSAVERLNQGKWHTRLNIERQKPDAVTALGLQINLMASTMEDLLQEQTRQAQQTRLLTELATFRVFNQQEVNRTFNQSLHEARKLLGVDRVVIYRFRPDWSGYVLTESVGSNLPQALDQSIEDACIPENLLLAYQDDRVVATNDVLTANFHPDHLKLMERLRIKANLVVPILNHNQLFGLLIAHHCQTTHQWQDTEIQFLKQLAVQLGSVLDRVAFLQSKEVESERAQLLNDITLEIGQAENSEEMIFRLPVVKIRQAIQADRVIVYRFDPEWRGTVIAESVADLYPRALGAEIYDPCFAKDYVGKYEQGRVQATPNIYEAGLTECHLRQLEPFAVQANLVAPIKQGGQLLGLLIAHQCDRPRVWEQSDITFFTQVATQLGLGLDRANLLKQKELAAEQAQQWAQEQQQQKEELQRQLVALLEEIEEAASGNLTVRANITNGDLGTVADFFNVIVENLRQIVTQVKQSALQVNGAIGENDEAMRQLTNTALHQAEEINLTLGSMQQMIASIQTVADRARQAAKVANSASATAEAGGTLMNGTVESIYSLRETIGQTAKKVKRLGEFSQEISKVVALIEKITLQTNLLAVNAGMEAARAGEEGHGFAIVAEEIGQLAAQSTNATREIETIVETIRKGTSEVVEAMEQSTNRVVEGTRLVKGAKSNLEEIIQVSHHIAQLVRSISEATVTQTQTSESVMQVMQGISEVSQQTSTASHEVSMSLQKTAEIAKALLDSVVTFKVEMNEAH